MTTDHRDDLESLLADSVDQAAEKERTTFDRLAAPFERSLVLYGAGGLGRKTLAALRRHAIEPLAFADASEALRGTRVDGVEVLSPEDAVRRHGTSAAFVVCVFSPGRERRYPLFRDRLRAAGATRVLSFLSLFWKYADELLPHLRMDRPTRIARHAAEIREVFGWLADDRSRAEFVTQLRWLVALDGNDAMPPDDPRPVYFPSDVVTFSGSECFVDCGAYDGDTIATFLSVVGGAFREIHAFEPDPGSFAALERRIGALDEARRARVRLHRAAVAARPGTLRFEPQGAFTSAVTDGGSLEVACVTLDDTVADAHPTLIKMDLEGGEIDALTGGLRTIAACDPVTAICVYHRQEHLWEVPRLIRSASPGTRFLLRRYDEWDNIVCYGVPEARLSIG